MAFAFEDLKVYQDALTWVEQANKITEKIRSEKSIVDQLNRAALSVPLNIAEGNERWHKGEKRQFFWIARGSVFECVALIQVLKRSQTINDDLYSKFYSDLESLAKMLSGLIKSTEEVRA
jgi:four helix bundle protein